MKHVSSLAAQPALLAQYCLDNPAVVRWETFRNECRAGYEELIGALSDKQRNLCAFCEIELLPMDRHVEHWRPKSLSTIANNLTFVVSNLTASCENRSKAHWFADLQERGGNPAPGPNESCGPFKGKDDPLGLVPRPYEPSAMPVDPPVFKVLRDGKLEVDENAANTAGLQGDKLYATLELLNLNCTRLKNARRAVIEALNHEFEELTNSGVSDTDALIRLAEQQLRLDPNGALPRFLTTLRSYFGQLAEDRLATIPNWAATP